MTSVLKIFYFVLLTLTLCYGAADSTTACRSNQSPVTKIVNSLSLRLEQMLETQDNYFFSPISISIALAMVYVGARGTTREQMADALEYDIIGRNCLPNKISESFRGLIRSLRSEREDYKFLIANGAFMQKDYQISHFYSASLERYFNSRVNFVNFAEEDVAAMKKINEWVANATKGKISELIAEPLDPLTIMVLINAVYFKGLWDLPFNEEATRDRIFYRINKSEKSVPFMTLESKIHNYYDEERKYSIIELEYLGGNVSMIVILPKDENEFPRYDLTSEVLCNLRSKFQYTSVTVIMPRFKLEFKRELSKDMIRLGMEELFSERADLSGIRETPDGNNDVHVSLMVHKAVIEVNEKGSEASSIIGVVIDGRNKVTTSEVFLANHPFLFYIIHKETNTILFSGRVVDP